MWRHRQTCRYLRVFWLKYVWVHNVLKTQKYLYFKPAFRSQTHALWNPYLIGLLNKYVIFSVYLESLNGGHIKSVSWSLGTSNGYITLVVTRSRVKIYVGCKALHWHPLSSRHNLLSLLASQKLKLVSLFWKFYLKMLLIITNRILSVPSNLLVKKNSSIEKNRKK